MPTKLFLEGFQIEIGHGIFWMMMGIIAVLGLSLVYRDYYQRKTRTQYHHRLLEQFKAHQVTLEPTFREIPTLFPAYRIS